MGTYIPRRCHNPQVVHTPPHAHPTPAQWCERVSSQASHCEAHNPLLLTRWSTRYCNQDLLQKKLKVRLVPSNLHSFSSVHPTQRRSALWVVVLSPRHW